MIDLDELEEAGVAAWTAYSADAGHAGRHIAIDLLERGEGVRCYATSGMYLCQSACLLTGAMFKTCDQGESYWLQDEQGRYICQEDGPCAEALIAQWAGLDQEAAEELVVDVEALWVSLGYAEETWGPYWGFRRRPGEGYSAEDKDGLPPVGCMAYWLDATFDPCGSSKFWPPHLSEETGCRDALIAMYLGLDEQVAYDPD